MRKHPSRFLFEIKKELLNRISINVNLIMYNRDRLRKYRIDKCNHNIPEVAEMDNILETVIDALMLDEYFSSKELLVTPVTVMYSPKKYLLY